MTLDPTWRTMVDSAWPHQPPHPVDIVLIYAGGDTPHPWTPADIASMPQRWRWPCWVRSNPGQVSPHTDAGLFITWLRDHAVPENTCVILDLETAVSASYVTGFNLALRAAGYKVTKYGSLSTIWQNPRTDGGTYVADPSGEAHMVTTGDTVATQWAFDGGYDLSVVKDQAAVPLWDTQPAQPTPAPPQPVPWEETMIRKLPTLTTGATGMAVRRMQALLIVDGENVGTAGTDGKFGPDTKAAVLACQRKHGLRDDGMVASHTWSVLVTGADL